jgi:antitoxin CptB
MEPYVIPTEPVPDPRPVVPSGSLDPRRRRILFRATHRGTHETDLLIGGFVSPRIAGFSEAELDSLEELMELPDIDLADWLMGRRPVPPECDTPMLRAVLAAARSRPFAGMTR